MRSRFAFCLVAMGMSVALGGCVGLSRYDAMAASEGLAVAEAAKAEAQLAAERKFIWTAGLSVEVGTVAPAAARAAELTTQAGGYVETQSFDKERSASLRLRVPAAALKNTVAALENLGKVTSRHVNARDVTEQYVDIEARLKNMAALRDRLKELLGKATDVKDVLALETELNRVQSDLDSLEARMRVLKGQVELATIDLTLDRRPIYGPLGYFFKGLWWGIEKLFVIRD